MKERTFARQGRRPHLSVTLGLGTLAGLDEFPGNLAGFGAIPAGLARSIAKSAATISALLADPESGSVLKAGALTYRPRQELRDQIAALLEVCQFPSCRQPVWRCDMDHRDPFDHDHPEQGGRTVLDNSGPLCRRHHLFKHHTEWRCRPDPDRTVLHWSSPTGHRYAKPGKQVAPPALWVTTAGTAVAEKLDTLARFTWDGPLLDGPGEAAQTSVVEQLLAALVLRHLLTRPALEYEHSDSAWNVSASGQPDHDLNETNDVSAGSTSSTTSDGGPSGGCGEAPDPVDPNDEPPPF